MQRPPGFKSETQRENFTDKARLHGRGGPLSPTCGVRTRTGRVCTQVPIKEGKGRCLRHCGPDAARAHRETQLRQMKTGKTSPEAFARAEARRARNKLINGWKKNPSLPGKTIDLGTHEGTFRDAVAALGVDVDALYPAQSDWLRWRFQRTQVDRTADAAWLRAVRVDLPKQIRDADAAMVWVRLGSVDKRTKEGRVLKAALRTGGEAAAAALGLGPVKPAQDVQERAVQRHVRVWAAPPPSGPSKRSLPDRIKRADPVQRSIPKMPGRAARKVDDQGDVAALMQVYRAADPAVQRMFAALSGEDERRGFLLALKAVTEAPQDPVAQRRWRGVVSALHGVA